MRTRALPFAAAVLGAVLASERLAAAPTSPASEETRKRSAPNERRLKHDDIGRSLTVRKAKKPMPMKNQAGYEYQDWFDWQPAAVKPEKAPLRRPASAPSSRPPGRSDY